MRYALLAAILAVAAVRLGFCARVPVNTADLIRSIHTALYVLRDGPVAAGIPLIEMDPGLRALAWANVPYSYPPMVLPFFAVVAWLSPTLFAAKLALTAVEAANALLVSRITGSRWLGAIYWASPASIWWVSGEGQFEPLMAACMFGAVALVRTRPAAALAVLGVGVNVKLTAVLLLPWCGLVVMRERPTDRLRAALAFVAAVVLPLAAAGFWYPVLDGIAGIAGTIRYNPYYWNVFDRAAFRWNPGWLVTVNALATYGVLAVMIAKARSTEAGWGKLGGAIAFVLIVKVSSLAQFWYFLLFPAFVMPLEGERGAMDARWWLVALASLLDVRSLVELVSGPFGWIESAVYTDIDAFTPFGIR